PTVYMSQLNARNDRKQVKNSAKVGISNVKKSSASGGLRPPDQGLCPWTPLGAQPPDPHIGSRSRARHEFAPPRQPLWIRHCANFRSKLLQSTFGKQTASCEIQSF